MALLLSEPGNIFHSLSGHRFRNKEPSLEPVGPFAEIGRLSHELRVLLQQLDDRKKETSNKIESGRMERSETPLIDLPTLGLSLFFASKYFSWYCLTNERNSLLPATTNIEKRKQASRLNIFARTNYRSNKEDKDTTYNGNLWHLLFQKAHPVAECAQCIQLVDRTGNIQGEGGVRLASCEEGSPHTAPVYPWTNHLGIQQKTNI